MKKSSALLIAAALMLSSCGSLSKLASIDDSQTFQDGIYNNTPAFRTKAEKTESQSETQALAQKTKESQIYLFGDRKDTVSIPKDMSAMIRYDQKLGGTVVTVGENPYDWRYDLENNYGYYYGPYSIGSSWYWSRHYSPWYSLDFAPWRYRGWYDAWHYGSWYSPYYYGGFYGGWYDPWYWGSSWGWYDPWYSPYYNPYYCGWYGGWDPYWGHHHHHAHIGGGHIHKKDVWYGSRHQTGSERVFGSRTSLRGGIGTSSSISRNSSTSRSTSSRAQSSGGSSSRRVSSGRTAVASPSGTANRSSVIRTTPAIRDQKTAVRNTATAAQGTAVGRTPQGTGVRGTAASANNRPVSSTGRVAGTTQSNHRRPAATVPSSSIDRGSSSTPNYNREIQGAERPSGYDRSTSRSTSNTSSYNRNSSSSSSSRSSFSSGSSSSYSRGSSGGGYSGGGSRSSGSSGGRR